MPINPDKQRLAKAIAAAGLCSRREAEQWILAGRVAVNWQKIDTPAFTVSAEDTVAVDGTVIGATSPTRLWLYHKPKGLLTTHRDPQGRPTLFEQLPKDMPRVISVGRLDLSSEGLLLLTTDGALARTLELPATGLPRTYRVRMRGLPDARRLEALKNGVTVEGVRYGAIDARIDKGKTGNSWVTVTLAEGKNREIRRVFEHLGHSVSRLIRIGYGPFSLGNLAVGQVQEVPAPRLRKLQASFRVDKSQD